MSFFFKSKNKSSGLPQASRNITSSDGANLPNAIPASNGAYAAAKDVAERSRIGPPPAMAAVTPPYTRPGTSSPGLDPNAQRDRAGSDGTSQIARNPNVAPPQRPGGDLSLYPWSSRKLEFVSAQANPFPRYGAAVNAVASRDGDIYMMGGLINGTTVKGDLWIVEAASGALNCYPVPTTAEGPGPRVGHASLLVGNAFIVFGGDTKVDELDVLDDTLYLLNTSTKHWSRALPAGPRPAGRYGHTLNILGSKIYIFGGQVEGYFFNDLVAFDLNALQQPTNRWETLIQNTNDGGPPLGQIPPARTNHSVITYNDKLYLFGGTDGVSWFSDVWVYDPKTNSWAPQECIGFIPTAREGHAAALVGDVMYVFGGRTEEGKDLGDLAAFRIPTRRWYTFQNMGSSPSERSGHGMTAFGQHILVLGGEPSSSPRDPGELSLAYILDTAKIRYPPDRPNQTGPGQTVTGRRPSVTDRSATPQERSVSREGMTRAVNLSNKTSQESINGGSQSSYQGLQDGTATTGALPMVNPSARPARQAPILGPPGPPPQQQPPQPRANGTRSIIPTTENDRESIRPMSKLDRVLGPEYSRTQGREIIRQDVREGPLQDTASSNRNIPIDQSSSSAVQSMQDTPSEVSQYDGSTSVQSQRPSSKAAAREPTSTQDTQEITSTSARSVPGPEEEISKSDADKEPTMPGQFPVDSGLGSSPSIGQPNDEVTKELESVKNKNAWYASELALARKAGYRSSAENPTASLRNSEVFEESDKPLVEAFFKMRSELAAMQQSLDSQSKLAAEKVAQVERQRDAAIAEAVYSKQRLAGRGRAASGEGSRDIGTPDSERSEDANRRLANALSAQSDLTSKVRGLQNDVDSERKARQLAEESAESAHARASELDKHKQESASELEKLRSELHEAQKQARDEAANCAEAVAQHRLLEVDRNDMAGKLSIIQSDAQSHSNILATLRSAVTSSTSKADLLERKLEQERADRSAAEEKLAQLRSEHEARVQELDTTQRRLQDSEELAASHAEEARTHREAILAGFGQTRDFGSDDFTGRDERVSVLQQQLESAKSLARRHQEAADLASDKLRRAEERIGGLEAYQEQASREALTLRKQLQTASKDILTLQAEHTELQQQLTSEKLEAEAVQVQHRALKELLEERGIDTADLPQPRTSTSSSTSTSERLRELQQQLESSMKAHEDMRTSFEQREVEANRGWEEKLANLDNDYQSAVKYLKGTEKMLSKMKQELHRYKTQNKDLEEELSRQRSSSERGLDTPETSTSNTAWETERTSLQQQIDEMQQRISSSSTQLDQHVAELRAAQVERDSLQQQLDATSEQSKSELASMRAQNSALETRAAEAERKVQILLETVGNTVDNYKRQSQQMQQSNGGGTTGHSRGPSLNSIGDESVYDDDDNTSRADTRNSVALDSLANELETLRSHWETTNANYRLSNQSDLYKSPSSAAQGSATSNMGENLADWRKKLDLEENERTTA